MTLEEITDGMRKRLGANAGLNTTVKFDFGADGVIYVDDTATPTAIDNNDRPAQCTLTISRDDFIDLAAGRLDPTMAYMSGKLKVDDIATAMKVGNLLK